MVTVQQNGQEIEPEFRARVNSIYDSWQSGELPFSEAYKQLEVMKYEAASAGHLANQGGVEMILGIMQGYRAKLNESIRHFELARGLFEQAGNQERMTICMLNIGETYRLRGNFTRARHFFRAAYESAVSMENIRTQVTALANEGQMLLSMGLLSDAYDTLKKALELGRNVVPENDREANQLLDTQCEIHYALAVILLRLNEPETAWKHARKSLLIAEDLGVPLRMGYANRALGEVITALGQAPEEAFSSDPDTYFHASAQAFRGIRADGELAKTMYAHGRSLAHRQKRNAAARKLKEAMVLFTRLGMTDDAAKAAEAQLEVL